MINSPFNRAKLVLPAEKAVRYFTRRLYITTKFCSKVSRPLHRNKLLIHIVYTVERGADGDVGPRGVDGPPSTEIGPPGLDGNDSDDAQDGSVGEKGDRGGI